MHKRLPLIFLFVTLLFSSRIFSANSGLTGKWESSDGKFMLIHLADGRAASYDQRPYVSPDIRIETGTYKVQGSKISYLWMLSGPQEEAFSVNGTVLKIGNESPLHRTAEKDEAIKGYEQIYRLIRTVAESAHNSVTTGEAKRQTIQVNAMVPDTRPADVFPHATVFTQDTRFQWLLTPIHQYEVRNRDEPGFTCCSYTFLPNGRFCFDGWLYGVLVDDKVPFDERSPAEVLGREVQVRHQQFWGKYRLKTGVDVLESDTIELISNSGLRTILKTVDGRLYAVANERMLFSNYEQVKKYNQQALQKNTQLSF